MKIMSTRKIAVKLAKKKESNKRCNKRKSRSAENSEVKVEPEIKKVKRKIDKCNVSKNSDELLITTRFRAARKCKKERVEVNIDDFVVFKDEEKYNEKPSGNFICKLCFKSFIHKTNLYKHCRVVHNTKYENERVQCYKCDKTFSTQEKMEKHLEVHEQPDKRKNKPGLQCFMCKDFFRTYGLLEKHLVSEHEKSFNLSEMHFNSNEEFMKWRYEYENKCMCKYVRRETPYKLKEGGRRYRLQCHRSGFFKSRGKGIRKLKKLGSNKIEGTCPSTILVTETSAGMVSIRNFECHEGHDFNVERLTLTPDERAAIAGRLSEGVSEHQIIDSMSSYNEEKRRLHLLTRTDIRNIRRDFGIKGPGRSKKKDKTIQLQENAVACADKLITPEIMNSIVTEKTEGPEVIVNSILPEKDPKVIINTFAPDQSGAITTTEQEQELGFDHERSYTDLDDYHDAPSNPIEPCHNEAEIPEVDAPVKTAERDLIFEINAKCEMILALNSRECVTNKARNLVISHLEKAIKVLNNQRTGYSKTNKLKKSVKQRSTNPSCHNHTAKKKENNIHAIADSMTFTQPVSQPLIQPLIQPLVPLSQSLTQPINHPMSHQISPAVPQSVVQRITSSNVQHLDHSVLTEIHHQTDLNDSFSRTTNFVDSVHSGYDSFVSCVLEIGGHNNASFT